MPRIPNQKLIDERIRRRWSQQEVADRVGTTPLNVGRWERGITIPRAYFRQQLSLLFGKSVQELGLVPAAEIVYHEGIQREVSQSVVPLLPLDLELYPWNVPFRRNPFFTGREQLLMNLRKVLQTEKQTAITQIQAMSGLGGIGKTQLALEYAYRYRDQYQAVFWMRAETRDHLLADCTGMAEILSLNTSLEDAMPQRIIEKVRRWLQGHTGWLLIMDNVEDVSLVDELLPLSVNGHILLTTRVQATGPFAQRCEIECMEPDEGALFILRRAKLLASEAGLSDAAENLRMTAYILSNELGRLPLALDQAGAYIEETGCSLNTYLDHYKQQHAALLARRGNTSNDHPLSVSATVALSFNRIAQANPAAADLLRLCAFMHGEAIAEEIIVQGAADLGDVLAPVAADVIQLDEAIAVLRASSLLRREAAARTLVLHRLVQVILKDHMDEEVQQQWAERAVRVVNCTFPETNEIVIDAARQRIFPQVFICMHLIQEWNMQFAEAGRLLMQMGNYLQAHARYNEATEAFQQALHLRQRLLGPEHEDVAEVLNDLALLTYRQGNYAQAEAYGQQALALTERLLGNDHIHVSVILNNLLLTYCEQNKYREAEAAGQRALLITERLLGSYSVAVARCLNNLALCYRRQGKYSQAMPMQEQSLRICEQVLGSEHPYLALTLNNMAALFYSQGQLTQAKSLYERALVIGEQALGPQHPDVARYLHNIARFYYDQGELREAQLLFHRALKIRESTLGPTHPDTIKTAEQYTALSATIELTSDH